MSASIYVTPGVHEKFTNYKYSSAFREKSDAELLEYFLDSFEAIGCLVKLGIRSELLSNNEAQYTPTIPTVVPLHQEGPATQKVQRARKSTPSSGFKTIRSSGCTKVLESSTPTDFNTNNSTPEEEGPSPLRRSSRSSSELPINSSKEPSRRKSTQNTVGSSRPPPLAISPLIKIELVDVNEGEVSSRGVSATFGTISGITLTTPSEETEEDELKPSALQPREMSTNEQQPSEIGALYFKRNTDALFTESAIHPPYNPSDSTDSPIRSPDTHSVSTAFTIHPPDNPSVSTASTKHPPDNPSVSTASRIHPSDNPSVSTASTELPSYETGRLPTHLNTANGGGQYLCSNCYEMYNTEIELQQHMCVIKRPNTKQVKENKFKCETCGKILSRKYDLKQHIRCVHEKIKQFSCPYCHYRSYTNQNMTTHLAKHLNVKKYKCTQCDYTAVAQPNLTVHINTHHTNKTHRCTYKGCGVKKTSQEELYEHIRSYHPVKRFPCDTCPMSFSTSQNLNQHKVSHNKDSRAYQCKYCERRFGRSDTLVKHYRTHAGDKPYKCKVCGKKFNQISSLTSHKVTHTGEKRFSCSNCDRTYWHNNSKSRHEIKCKYK